MCHMPAALCIHRANKNTTHTHIHTHCNKAKSGDSCKGRRELWPSRSSTVQQFTQTEACAKHRNTVSKSFSSGKLGLERVEWSGGASSHFPRSFDGLDESRRRLGFRERDAGVGHLQSSRSFHGTRWRSASLLAATAPTQFGVLLLH